MKRNRWSRRWAGLAVIGLIVAGCARAGATPTPASSTATGASGTPASVEPGASPSAVAAATCEGASDKGEVKMMVNEWVGAAANVAVAQCLLQQMGYKVTNSTLAEEVAWQGFETGDVDVILENWGHPDLEKKYIQETKLAVDAGPMGVKGIIGWYVPKWMVDKYPDITDWNNLNKYASLFKTSESGDKGQFLGASPAFVQYDEALITNLKLDYKVVFSGSEAASITAFQQATKNQTPLIGYFYDPQWLLNEIELVQVKLPAWTAGCDADLKKVACDYPAYTLNKIVRTKWLEGAGDAGTFIKNFQWSNADQNSVADAITNKNMKELDAAKVWIDANAATWQKWMP
ncbi:MAG TPA: ABC transporter substrate-binding protein [Patescibacteria group bacterium]|nr:ABC transporter substrate-binding protein [Patescibacteria group bacterium]